MLIGRTNNQSWRPMLWAYVLYACMTLAAQAIGADGLGLAGAGVVLLCAAWMYAPCLATLPAQPRAVAAVIALACPLLMVSLHKEVVPAYLVKHVAMYGLYLLILVSPLRPLTGSGARRWMLAAVVAVLVIGMALPGHDAGGEQERISGVFVNPNNLALMAMALLVLADPRDSRWTYRGMLHGGVLALLWVSGTSGALLAYGVAMSYRIVQWSMNEGRRYAAGLAAAVVLTTAVGVFFPMGNEGLLDRVERQGELMQSELADAWSGRQLNYYQLGTQYGMDSLSGVWRIAHWRKAFDVLADSDPIELALGRGCGSSIALLGLLPHNDYLRLLLEQGVAGLSCFVAILWTSAMRLPPSRRFVVLMVALYCFTENNLDNYLFMSLLMMFLGSIRVDEARPQSSFIQGQRRPQLGAHS